MTEIEGRGAPVGAKTTMERLDDLFAPWSRTDAPGLVVGVALAGEVIYRRGFGMASLETGAANTPATRMRIGSTSKHFTCLLALLLAEEGKFDLDRPIRDFVPELTGPGGDLTPRLLLQHRGGSRCYLDLAFIAHGLAFVPKGAALAAQVRQKGRNFAPGEAMIYNNGGYHLVSLALERAGGAPFEQQLRDRLFTPVGMHATASVPTDMEITPGIATMHLPLPDGRWRRGVFPSDEVRGEGAIVSTVDDMLGWMAHLRTRDRFGSAEAWRQLEEPPTYADGSKGAYALGLMLGEHRGIRILHHAGGVIGGSSQMLTAPDDGFDVIIMANGAKGADPVRLAEQTVDIVLADRVGPEPAKVSAKDHAALVGDWWNAEGGLILSLADDEDALKLKVGMPIGMELRAGSDGTIVLPAGSVGAIEFDPNNLSDGGGLMMRFGVRTYLLERLATTDGEAARFAEAAIGDYWSDDADAEATIRRDGADIVLSISDGYGRVVSKAHPRSARLASTTPVSGYDFAYWTVQLDPEGDKARRFWLSSVRTRGLEFRRRQ